MLNFKRLTLDDIGLVRPFFAKHCNRACDFTVGGLFMWRDYFYTEYCICGGNIIFKIDYLDMGTAFSFPIGDDVSSALDEIEGYCRESSIPLIFCTVISDDLERLRARYGDVEAEALRDWSDYLYLAEDFISLSGKKYHGQRNQINKFIREYPDFAFVDITHENLASVRDFFCSFEYSSEKENEEKIINEDHLKVLELLDNYDKYALIGMALTVDGKIVGFSIGERLCHTLFVHIEKADVNYSGCYQMLANGFAERAVCGDTVYINREDDSGDEGLRQSKLSWHPCELLEKYTVRVKQ